MSSRPRPTAALMILAGGQSRRFGADKSLLCVDGAPVVERLISRLGILFGETVVVSERPGKFRLPGVLEAVDVYPGRGPLGGVHAGLLAIRAPWAFVLACDMPAVTLETAGALWDAAATGQAQAVIPHHRGGYEPLCAMYSRGLLPRTEALLGGGGRPGLVELLRGVNVAYLETEDCFFNMNTQEDAARALWETGNAAPARRTRYRAFVKGTESAFWQDGTVGSGREEG